jgi:hypothetical protein
VSNDAVVTLTYAGCTVEATTTVVRVQLDKFCYNRADPYPEVEVVSVEGLVPGQQATVTYKVLDDMLDKDLPELTATFAVEEAFGTYEYKTPDYLNRIGNAGHDAVRYTVYDDDGTKAVRWSHADPDRKALASTPSLALMDIEIKDALAATPEEALGHLAPTPAFAGDVEIDGSMPSYAINAVKVLAKTPSPAYTNEVHAEVGNEEVLQRLHGKADDSAVVLEVSGPRVVGVNDRFSPGGDSGSDPGDDAAENQEVTDPDFIELTLDGVPDCIVKGTVEWEVTEGADRARLVSAPAAAQVATLVSHDFAGSGPVADMLRVHVEGRDASDVTDDVAVTARVTVDDSEDNPRAFRGQTLEAEFKLTVTGLRWTGWKKDNEGGRTDERTDLLVCDLDLRPAVQLDQPLGGAGIEQGGSLSVSGSVRSMVDIVTDIRVNGAVVPPSNIRFLGESVGSMTAESVRALTDRPPPYVVTFEHTVEEFSADEVLVEARNGVGERPGFAVRRVGYADADEGQPSSGTVSERLVASPAYDLPDMAEFFDAQAGWESLFKTEVDHCGAGVGKVDCRETCGAQPGDGLFRLRLPVVFVSDKDLNGAIPGPGLFLEDDFSEPVEAKYGNGQTTGIRKLFTADLLVEGQDGGVPDAEEWWRGAALVVDGDPGKLTVKNPFDQADLPEDAELTLEVEDIDDEDNPFAGFAAGPWSADTMSADVEMPLTPDGAGSAAFVLTLASPKYGLLAKDRVRVGVLRANVLVDSLNQHGFGTPVDSDEVEDVEDDPNEPGKIVLVNDGDEDADGIVDYADGFDRFAEISEDDTSSGVSFVPVVFEIPEPIDVSEAVVTLSYSASDPGAVTTNGLGACVLPAGHLRLWAQDGSAQRSTNPVWRAVAPGDYLPPTPSEGVPATELGFSDSQRTLTFYLEAVGPSGSQGDQRIAFKVDPDGDGPLDDICTDAARVTAVAIELREVALDQDGYPLEEGGNPVLEDIIPWTDSLSTYVPYDGGGAPNLESTSQRWVTFSAVTNSVTNSATLTMSKDDVDGFRVWGMDFECVTTNGAYAWVWQGTSNAFMRAEVPTNAIGATMPITLTYLDSEFGGLTNTVQEFFTLYRHEQTNGFWGSTYSITDPREDIGMPAFSSRNAFAVRVPPLTAELFDGNLVCEMSVGEGDPVSIPLAQDDEGAYVSCVVVPVSALDGEADLGLEASVNVVKIKFEPDTERWEMVKVNIGSSINSTMQEIAERKLPVNKAALFSALVSNEENGERRANQAVVAAGETAISQLKLGVTPLFSPTKAQINDMLKRHRVWVHSGHGCNTNGITIVRQVDGGYRGDYFKASDIEVGNVEYDLVFMNTCMSTDRDFVLGPGGSSWSGPFLFAPDRTAVWEIGKKLKAKNYVGWDCSVPRALSVEVPNLLMQELDSTASGSRGKRTVAAAVAEVRSQILIQGKPCYWFRVRLRCADPRDDSVCLDLNKKPF